MKRFNTYILTCNLIVLVLAVSPNILAQNQLDEHGRKTGHWVVEYSNGKIMYEGDFLEGKPVGEMTRYTEEGHMKARIRFYPGNKRYVTMYFPKKKKAAEGIYQGERKDSTWTYYSERDGTIRMREKYAAGVQHGLEERYYPEGGVSETFQWSEGLKDGQWHQFFEDGSPRLQARYSKGVLEGHYKLWSGEGLVVMEGMMRNNVSDGEWSYFGEDGELKYTLEYKLGVPVDRELYQRMIDEQMMKADTTVSPDGGQLF